MQWGQAMIKQRFGVIGIDIQCFLGIHRILFILFQFQKGQSAKRSNLKKSHREQKNCFLIGTGSLESGVSSALSNAKLHNHRLSILSMSKGLVATRLVLLAFLDDRLNFLCAHVSINIFNLIFLGSDSFDSYQLCVCLGRFLGTIFGDLFELDHVFRHLLGHFGSLFVFLLYGFQITLGHEAGILSSDPTFPYDSLRGKFSLLIATRDKLKFLFHDIANGLGAATHHWRRRILL
jgi:hypothetical protein